VNIKEYISSGIVESYVLGLADDAERKEFEQMCSTHPEVKAARDAFERSLEQHALANAVPPPDSVRANIYKELNLSQNTGATAVSTAPVVRMNWSRYVAAAAIILLVGSTALNFYFFSQYKQYSSQYQALVEERNVLVKNNQALQASLRQNEDMVSVMKDTANIVVKMSGVAVPAAFGTSPDPSSVATVYWNSLSKDVVLLINRLPQPATDKQYQLWAIVDGKPVDAGVFDTDLAMIKMKNIPRAQLFAITLEKKGGSPTPQGAMYVLGKI
jgi:anti-sigma-K factor RskA